MNVLSLFDGMSCGQIALNKIGITPVKYYAAEVDKYAIKVTQANFPNTVQLGDVNKWREWNINWSSIDLLIGGSPCQGFSFAGKQLAFDDPRSALFFVYVDILNHIKSVNPRVKFMLENVKMKKEYLDVISRILEVEPVFINSNLVSAQNRQRFYWANWTIEQPADKGIFLKDILDSGFVDREKGHCLTASYHKGVELKRYIERGTRQIVFIEQTPRGKNPKSYFEKHRRQLAFNKPIRTGDLGRNSQGYRTYSAEGKSPCILANPAGGNKPTYVGDPVSYRKLTPIECERLQTVPDNYTNHVSNTQRYKMLGNGWTVDVVTHIFSQAEF